jgi:hypothetical protein
MWRTNCSKNFSQPKGQLMESQYPEIQKRQPVFDGEQGSKAIS